MNPHVNAFVPYSRSRAREDDLTRAAMIFIRCVALARQALLDLIAAPSITKLIATAKVIESKLHEGAPSDQAVRLNGQIPSGAVVRRIAWHDLFAAWQRLQDQRLLASAESFLLEDLFEFCDAAFPQVMPFRRLRQARGHDRREQRFLRALLRTATGAKPAVGGNYVRLDDALGTRCVQRAYLGTTQTGIYLSMHPAEDKPQALNFYTAGRATRFAQLEDLL